MNNKMLWSILAVVAIVVAVMIFLNNQPSINQTGNDGAGMMLNDDKMTDDQMDGSDDKMMDNQDDQAMMSDGEVDDKMMSDNKGVYLNYSSAVVADQANKGYKTVLFFYADWCPFCRSADQAFTDRLAELPTKTAVVKVNYDKETDLKNKYAVTYQHTFVQIDESGKVLSRWSGGDLDNLKKYLK